MTTPASTMPLDTTSRAVPVEVLYWVLIPISGVFLALRFWCRRQNSAIGLDDWLMAFAWVISQPPKHGGPQTDGTEHW
jgi:hypothetical protein